MNPYRSLFPIFTAHPELVYLDSAATSQKPEAVISSVADFCRTAYANPHRSIYPLGVQATEAYENARATIGHAIGAEPEETVFTSGATESINLLASTLPALWNKGDEVILSQLEHHANLVPWQQAADRYGIVLRFAEFTAAGEIDYRHLRSQVTPKTRLVSLSHCSNIFGTITDSLLVRKILRQEGSDALLFLDASQSMAHFPVNARDLECDFLVFSAHKMYGPSGIGILWGKRELLERLPPYRTGGEMIRTVSLTSATWNALPWRLEAGTPSIEGAVGFAAAVRFLEGIGMGTVEKHTASLTSLCVSALSTLPSVTILGSPSPAGGIVSFTVEGIHPHDLADLLGQRGICIRAGHQCAMPLHDRLGITASCRISIGLYTTEGDILQSVTAIKEILREVAHV